MRTGSRAAIALAVAALAAHGGPAVAWFPGPRRVFLPALAGIGRADHVALTFDDGPDPAATPWFLDTLEALAVRATFFVLGHRSPGTPAGRPDRRPRSRTGRARLGE